MLDKQRYIILAANPLPNLWPVSSVQRPYSLVRGADGRSPFERLLRAIRAIEETPHVTVVTSTLSAHDVKLQLQETQLTNHEMMLVSARVDDAVLMVLAAMFAARKNRQGHLVFLPTNMLASSQQRLVEAIRLLRDADYEDTKSIAMLAKPIAKNDELKPGQDILIAGNAGRAQWVPVTKIMSPGSTDAINASLPSSTGLLATDAMSCTSTSIIECAQERSPILAQACSHALEMASGLSSNIIYPKDSFLSLAGDHTLTSLIASKPDRVRLLAMDDGLAAATDWSERLAIDLAATPTASSKVQIIGYDDARRVEFDGKTLVLAPGAEHLLNQNHIHRTATSHRDLAIGVPEYSFMRSGDNCDVWLLNLPCETKTERECHFTRSEHLLVLEGSPSVTVDGQLTIAKPGDHIDIEPGAMHHISNPSDKTVRILETRIGTILDDDDRLLLHDQGANDDVSRFLSAPVSVSG